MTEIKPAVVYAAKSSEDRHGSIPTQLEDCRAMAEKEGWTVVAEFSDEAFSAYSGNRGPGLAQARLTASEHAPCVLVCQHSDRLARGAGDAPGAAEHLAEILFWARRHGVELRSVQDDFAFSHPLLTFALGERNYEDSRRKGLAVKDGQKRRATRGLQNGGPPPYGYQWHRWMENNEPRCKLAIHEPEAVIVRRIYAEYIAGRGQRQIARDLNAEGIPAQRGGSWHPGTIARYLAKPLYRGVVRLNGTVYDGRHDAIVDEETWEEVRQLREAMTRTYGGGRGRHATGGHLFQKGHLRCGKCGEAMVPLTKPTRTPGQLYEVYACYGRIQHGTDSCSQQPVKRGPIDSAVWNCFAKVALDVEATKAAIAGVPCRR